MTIDGESNLSSADIIPPTPHPRSYGATSIEPSSPPSPTCYQRETVTILEDGPCLTNGTDVLNYEQPSAFRRAGVVIGALLSVSAAVSLGRSWWTTSLAGGQQDVGGAMLQVLWALRRTISRSQLIFLL